MAEQNREILKVEHLKKYFPVPNGMLHAVDDISFTIEQGKTLGVVGESGCGKSTMGRAILRLHEPTSGKVYFDQKDILSFNDKQMKDMRRDMQIIFQDPFASLNPRMTVSEAIAAPLLVQKIYDHKDKDGIQKRVREIMLLDIGVQCSVEVLEFGSYISRTTAGEHDMAYFGWTTSSGDADYTYYSLEHSTQQGAAGNRSFIADPDLDALIEEARSNTDESARKDLYKDIAIMLAEINNNIPVFYSAINVGANKKVEGFVMDSNGYHNLNQVKVAQ